MLITAVQYPGVDTGVVAARGDCAQGVTPGRFTLTLPVPLGTIDEVGDLVIGDGEQTVTVPRCRVADLAVAGGDGAVPRGILCLEDRRWEWATGQISGRYNVPAEYRHTVPLVNLEEVREGNQSFTRVPVPPGEEPIRPETAKTARELCELCLTAMGETTWDVSAIDPTAYPAVEWDTANPAQALQALAARFGCRVVYRYDTDSVTLCKEGVGGPLPDGPLLLDAPDLKPKPRPKRVVVRSAHVRHQLRFHLEAVGLDFDGSWRPLNELSFCPTGDDGEPDWTLAGPPPTFAGLGDLDDADLPGDRTKEDAEALANQWVYRAYRLDGFAANGEDPLKVPPDGDDDAEVLYPKQVILLPNKSQVTRDDLGRRSPAPAQCFGVHWPPRGNSLRVPAELTSETDLQTEVVVPFAIDAEHQLVVFSDYVYRWDEQTEDATPADIVLETACHVADRETFALDRREYARDVPGGLADQPSYVVREELLAAAWAKYDADNELEAVEDNDDDLKPRAAYYLAAEVLKLVPDAAQTRIYPGIQPIFPDGAIQQVSWQLGGGSKRAPSTTASLNTEHSVYQPPYRQRRTQEELDFGPVDRTEERRAAQDRKRNLDG